MSYAGLGQVSSKTLNMLILYNHCSSITMQFKNNNKTLEKISLQLLIMQFFYFINIKIMKITNIALVVYLIVITI